MVLTLSYKAGFYAMPATLLARLDAMENFSLLGFFSSRTGAISQVRTTTAADSNTEGVVVPVVFKNVRVGTNIIEILPNLDPPPATDLFLYAIRITVGYTFVS